MTEQEIQDQEWFDKYGIKNHRNIKHGRCPYCGGNDVYVNDSPGDVDETVYFQLHCSDCDKNYQAVYVFSYCVTKE